MLRRGDLAIEPLLQVVERRRLEVARRPAVRHRARPRRRHCRPGRGTPPRSRRRCARTARPALARGPAAPGCRPISTPPRTRPASSFREVHRLIDRVAQHHRMEARPRGRCPAARLGPRARRTDRCRGSRGHARSPRFPAPVLPLISASAVLASRAVRPMRSAPVASFTSAQRSLIAARVSSEAISAGSFGLGGGVEQLDQVGERRQVFLRAVMRPDQRDGLAEIADIVVAEREQMRIDLGATTSRSTAGLTFLKLSAPVRMASAKPRSGSGVDAKYWLSASSLRLRDGVSASSSSSCANCLHSPPRPLRRSRRCRAARRRAPAAGTSRPARPRARASPRLAGASVSVMVSRSSFQSAWSEITSGSSTPDLPRPLLDAHPARRDRQHRVGQPPAPAVLDGAGRRDDDLAGELGLAASIAGRVGRARCRAAS